MNISSSDRDKILEELANEFDVGDIEPDEITCRMLAQRLNISRKVANNILNNKVEKGLFTTRWVRCSVGSFREKAYRKVKEK